MKIINISQALTTYLDNLRQPVVSDYQLALFIFQLHITKTFQGKNINMGNFKLQRSSYKSQVKKLLHNGILKQQKEFPHLTVFRVFGKNDPNPEQVACIVDPFAYVSHLCAMDHHGLTDRLPKILFLSSPPPRQWKEFANQRMQRDLGDHRQSFQTSEFPRLRRIHFDKIQKRPITFFSSLHLGAYKTIKDLGIRVSTIGRTFLDMIRRPDLCGGIHHVIDVFQHHTRQYSNLIIDEIDQHGKPIDKVRAGYILEEKCGVEDPIIESWQTNVQRGGSRKLDPVEEYSSKYSERWCLSLNI